MFDMVAMIRKMTMEKRYEMTRRTNSTGVMSCLESKKRKGKHNSCAVVVVAMRWVLALVVRVNTRYR